MKNTRQDQIIDLIIREKTVSIEKLTSLFDVSIQTIRRDIAAIEKTGIITKVYGGIQLATQNAPLSSLDDWNIRAEHCRPQKIGIAHAALELIPDNTIIGLDIGTTTYELARLLYKKKRLSVLTTSLLIANELSANEHHSIYCMGGLVSSVERSTSGMFAKKFLENFNSLDLFIMGADGFSLQRGVTEVNESLVDIKRHMVAMASKTILLVDHSKFGKESLFQSCPVDHIDTIITDNLVSRKDIMHLKHIGRNVIVVS